MEVVKEYDSKLDDKKRITIRGAGSLYYRIREYKNGKIELTPQILIETTKIQPETLKMINESMKNFKNGKVSPPIDLSEFELTDESDL